MFDQVEAALVTRAGGLVPELGSRTVSLGDLLEAKERPATPALAVAFDGYKVVGDLGDEVKLESRWIVAIAVASARQTGAAPLARASALGIAVRLLRGLIGWRPVAGCTRFKAADPGGPLWDRERGLYILPIAISTCATFAGVDDEF